VPQLFGSDWVSTQAPEHPVCVLGQQIPFETTSLLGQKHWPWVQDGAEGGQAVGVAHCAVMSQAWTPKPLPTWTHCVVVGVH
jgi:hypothetical protein